MDASITTNKANPMSCTRNVPFAVTALLVALLFSVCAATTAWADKVDEIEVDASADGLVVPTPPEESVENAGNLFSSAEETTEETTAPKAVRDYYWAGADALFAPIEAGGDIIMAGKSISLDQSKAGGSVRIAGKDLVLSNVTAANNFTMAGQTITMENCKMGGGVYCAGQEITFDGTAHGGALSGDTIVLNGKILGDISIAGKNIQIGPNAVVKGTLSISSDTEPTIPESAKIDGYTYTNVDTQDFSTAMETAGAAAIALLALSKVIGAVGTIIFALVLAWLFRRPVENAAALTRAHAGKIFATGAIAVIAAPIALVLLFCLVVTAPLACALLCGMILLGIVAVPFAAASLARLVFPKMNRIGAAALGGLALGIASIIPFLGGLVSLAALLYVVGYAVQTIWSYRKDPEGGPAGVAGQAGPGAPGVPGAPVAPAGGYPSAVGMAGGAGVAGAQPVQSVPSHGSPYYGAPQYGAGTAGVAGVPVDPVPPAAGAPVGSVPPAAAPVGSVTPAAEAPGDSGSPAAEAVDEPADEAPGHGEGDPR